MRPNEGPEALPPLLLTHPIGRWIASYGNRLENSIPPGRVVTITATYASRGFEKLPAAAAQAKVFERRLHAIPVDALKPKVREMLDGNGEHPIALLYLAGHGNTADYTKPDNAVVHLDDGDLYPVEVDTSETRLGTRCGTFVFFNACTVGKGGRVLGLPAGWPAAFLARDFRGYVAPISRVWERDAAEFAEAFVTYAFDQGMSIGRALLAIRRDLGTTSPTALAYIYYGDVMARFQPLPIKETQHE